jgi:hypothetical protein
MNFSVPGTSPKSLDTHLGTLVWGWRQSNAGWGRRQDGDTDAGRGGVVYPETSAVDSELDAAKRAREAQEARGNAQQRGAGAARHTRGSQHGHGHGYGHGRGRGGGGSAAGDGQRPARARRGRGHELRRERLLGPAVGACELGERRLHFQRLAAPRAPHLDELRRRRRRRHDDRSNG